MATEGAGHRIKDYMHRVEQHPESAGAHFNLALAYTHRGLADHAERHYRTALELEPDLVEAWVNLGGVLLLKWDFKGSIAANEEALKRKDDLSLAHYNIGQAFLYLGDADGVVRSCRRVLRLDPGHARGHYLLAVGLLAAGRSAEAHEELARAKALGHSPTPEFLRALGAAAKEPVRHTDSNIVTRIGANAPDAEKEN